MQFKIPIAGKEGNSPGSLQKKLQENSKPKNKTCPMEKFPSGSRCKYHRKFVQHVQKFKTSIRYLNLEELINIKRSWKDLGTYISSSGDVVSKVCINSILQDTVRIYKMCITNLHSHQQCMRAPHYGVNLDLCED